MSQITVTQGKDKEFSLFVTKSNGRPRSITGWSLIRVRLKKSDGTELEKFAPDTAGVDEVQTLTGSAVPVSGSYKLQAGSETTVAIAFDAVAADVQTALRALNQFSELTVSGTNIQSGFTVTFAGADGSRDQPTLVVLDNDMVDALAADVTIAVATTTPGTGKNGIEVVEEACGELKVFLNEVDTASLKAGLGQGLALDVRIGAEDLPLKPLEDVLDVFTNSV